VAAKGKIGVVGAGSWGTALAVLLAERHPEIHLWGHNPEIVRELADRRTNATYLPGVDLPPNISVTSELPGVLDADILLVVTPSVATRGVAGAIARAGVRPDTILVSCTKGIEHGTGKLMTQVLGDCLPGNPLAVLSGPNHATEVAQRIPAAAVLGSADPAVLARLQEVFSLPTFRPYTSDDVAGIQLGGALKNIFAIAAGVSDGFGMGDNAKAALVTRSLAEMMRLGVALGGRRETFGGLSGIGDLMVTCFSRHGRNRLFGERIGRGETREEIERSMKMVAEGVPTALSAWECARRLGIDAPVTREIHAVLYESKVPREAMWELLGRPPRAEQDRRPD